MTAEQAETGYAPEVHGEKRLAILFELVPPPFPIEVLTRLGPGKPDTLDHVPETLVFAGVDALGEGGARE